MKPSLYLFSNVLKRFLFSCFALLGASNCALAQTAAEVEPNNTCSTGNLVDKGYITYTGFLPLGSGDEDVWLVPVTIPSGSISLTVNSNGLDTDGVVTLFWEKVSAAQGSVDACGASNRSVAIESDYVHPLQETITWTASEQIIYIRLTIRPNAGTIWDFGDNTYSLSFTPGALPLDGSTQSISVDPAGVKGARLWLDASQGVTKNGNTLTTWKDQTGTNTFAVSGNPQVLANGLNNNPTIDFDGIDDYLSGNTGIDFKTIYAVVKRDNTNFTTVLSASDAFGKDVGYVMKGDRLATGDNQQLAADQVVFQSSGSMETEKARLAVVEMVTGQDASNQKSFIDGKFFSTSKLAGQGTQFSAVHSSPLIGSSQDPANRNILDGQIAELIVYPTAHTPEERTRIQSYLAIKYGITLDPSVGQYLSNSGTVLWNNPNYWNDVFGIGKSALSALNQPVSYSLNTGTPNGGLAGKGNIVVKGNSALTGGSFLMIGNDAQPLTFTASPIPLFLPMKRKWKIKHTGNVGNVELTFDMTGLTTSATKADQLILLLDRDGDGNFTTGSPIAISASSYRGNIITYSNVALPDQAVFTIAQSVETVAPVFPNRIIQNPSFEIHAGSADFSHAQDVVVNTQGAGSQAELLGWYSSHYNFSVNGNLKIAPTTLTQENNLAKHGSFDVRISPVIPSYIYQNIYLINGESFDWSYYHKKGYIPSFIHPESNSIPDVAEFSIFDLNGKKLQVIDRSSTMGTFSRWDHRTGTTIVQVPTGVYRIGLETISSYTPAAIPLSNAVDSVTISLKALVEFSTDTIVIRENSQKVPYFLVNGQVKQPSSFTVRVTPGTAIAGTDYTVSAATKSVPVGNYALADSIPLGINLIGNNIPQHNRTFTITIESSTGDVTKRDADADGVYRQKLVVVIEDDDVCKSAGTDNQLSACAANATTVDLPNLAGKQDTGGNWTDVNNSGVNLANPNLVNMSALAPGTYHYRYLIPQNGICPSDTATITIEIREPFPAGKDSTVNICKGGGLINLLSKLGGTPMTGGVWTEQTSSGVSLTNPSQVNFNSVPTGTYSFVYTLSGKVECNGSGAVAVLTLNVLNGPNAGSNNSVNDCNNTPVNLFTSLGGTPDAGGSWTEITSSGVNISNPASVDFSAVAAGAYTFQYSVTGNSACATATSRLTVNVDMVHNAGTNNTVSVCNDGSTVNLFTSLGGTPDSGGSWTDTDASGVNLTDPTQVSFKALTAGDYRFTYTLTGTGGCANQSAIVTVTVVRAVNAGDKNTVSVCDGGGSTVVNLFPSLRNSPDAGGIWTETSTKLSGVSITDPTNVNFNGVPGGVYKFRYAVTATAPCGSKEAILTVKVNRNINAGSNTRVSICNEPGTTLDLFASLNGSPDAGGTWTETSAVSSGVSITDPTSVDFSGVTAGSYQFIYFFAGVGVCTGQSAILYVTVNKKVDAGTGGALSVCNGGTTPVNLFAQLGGTPDAGGTWQDLDATGLSIAGGIVGFGNVPAGTYHFEYLVNPATSCSAKSSTVTITVSDQPDAGEDGYLVVCSGGSGNIRNLMTSLKGTPDAGGTWMDVNSSGVNLSDPTAVDFGAVAAGTYQFKYTVAGTGGCTDVSATVTVIANQLPNAGAATQKTLCNGAASPQSINLLNLLDGGPSSGGTWSFSSTQTFDITNPAQVNISQASGTYTLTYTLNGEGSCQDASTTLTLNIEGYPRAGESAYTATLCNDNAVIDVLDLFTESADAGGSLTDNNSSGVNLTNPRAVSFAGVAPGDYNFSYTVTNSCGSDVAINTVSVAAPGNAGTNAEVTICSSETAYNLFGALGGTPDAGGTWTDNNKSDVVLGDGLSVDFSNVKKGKYRFTYHVENGSCAISTAYVDVTIEGSPYGGIANTVLICDAGNQKVNFNQSLSLLTSLATEWTDNSSSGVSLIDLSAVDFTTVANGRYTFTHRASALTACTASSATLTVVVNENGNAGTDGGTGICSGQNVDLTDLLGTFDRGGTWSDDDNAGVNLFDPTNVSFTGVAGGVYNFTYTLAPTSGCSNGSSATVTLTVDEIGNTGTGNTISICNGGTVNFMQSIGGSPDPGGDWAELTSSGVDFSNPTAVDFSAVSNGRYEFTYTQGSGGCGQVAAILVVNVGQAPNAGTSGSLSVCNATSTYNLKSALGTIDSNGTWKDQDNAGVNLSDPAKVSFKGVEGGVYRFTYSFDGANACSSSSSTVSVTVNDAPNPGTGTSTDLCLGTSRMVDLPNLLSGNPSAGGSWVDVNGAGVNLGDPSMVDFTSVTGGEYHFNYLVKGTGACKSASTSVIVNIFDQMNPGTPIADNVDVCNTKGIIYNLTSNIKPGYNVGGNWTVDNQVVTDPANFDLSLLPPGAHQAIYAFDASGSCVPAHMVYTLNIQQGPNAGAAGSLDVCDDAPISLFDVITGSFDAGGTWSNLDGAKVDITNPALVTFQYVPEGTYRFQYEVVSTGDCAGTVTSIVNIDVCSLVYEINPSEGVSPNGDGINDFWWIKNIEAFPNNTIHLFNGQGGLVFQIAGYNNDDKRFNGVANQNVVGGGNLTPGTYYYVIAIAGQKNLSGYITLLK